MDFWFAFTEPVDGSLTTDSLYLDTSIVFQVNVASKDTTQGIVHVFGSDFADTFVVIPGDVHKVIIPDTLAWISGSETVIPRAIHLTTDKPSVVYANTYHKFRSEATLVLPKRSLADEYRVITSSPLSKLLNPTPYTGPWRSEFTIVSQGESVTVEITPTAMTRGGRESGKSFNVTLDSGEIYQVQGAGANDDLTGSRIKCIDSLKSVAVYAGNEWTTVKCSTSADPLFEAQFPTKAWGKEYILIPTPKVGMDGFRVLANKNGTQILINGQFQVTLDEGEHWESYHEEPILITATENIALAQLMVSNAVNCSDIDEGDPSMVMINSSEQMYLDSITFFAVDEYRIELNYVTVITRTQDTDAVFLDSVNLSGFNVFEPDHTYSYKSQLISAGSHRLTTTGNGFLAYCMGLGKEESYSYAAGANLSPVFLGLGYKNLDRGDATICIGDSVGFNVFTSEPVGSYEWNFGDGQTSTDSAAGHRYESSGRFEYSIALISEWGSDTLFDSLEVREYPVPDIGPDRTICHGDSVVLSAGTNAMSFEWSNGTLDDQIVVSDEGIYTLIAANENCLGFDTMRVFNVDGIFIPNVITPNGDGINDEFKVSIDPQCSGLQSVWVWNRYGQLVFSTNYPNSVGWNGRTGAGELSADGVYFYLIQGKDQSFRGELTLISDP